MPKKQAASGPQDEPALSGFPGDGDEADLGSTEGTPSGNEPADPPEPKDPIVELREQLAAQERRHQEELASVRRQIAPPEPKAPPAPEKDPVDWDQLIFSKPKEAVAEIIRRTRAEVTTELEGKYRSDQGKQKFWDQFYAKNKDLNRDRDHDLVELTLNKNLTTLANIPVDQALDKLADLTRDRILGYVGGARRGGKKAQAEGSGTLSPRTPAEAPTERKSLSDVIRSRREKRGIAA